MSAQAEIASYIRLCQREYPGDWRGAHGIMGDEPANAPQLAAEMAYIQHNHVLPEWRVFIQSFEYVPESDSFIFAHFANDTA